MRTIYTGRPCTCKPGLHRDNCPQCEGSGKEIDFAAMRENPPEPEPRTTEYMADPRFLQDMEN